MARVEKRGSQWVEFTTTGITGYRFFTSDWDERFSVRPAIGEQFPGVSGLYCSRVRLEGFGKSVAAGGYTLCKIFANYASAPRTQEQEVGYVKESVSISTEAISKGGGAWKTKDGESVKDDDPAVIIYIPRLVYVVELTIDDISFWLKRLQRLAGKVNRTTWKGGKPDKWLFEGATSRNFVSEEGDILWTLTMSFIYRGDGPQTWNKKWRKDDSEKGGTHETVYFWDDKKLYDTVDFNKLVPTAKSQGRTVKQ